MDIWANSDTKPKRSTESVNRKNSFAERVYQPLYKLEVGLDREPGLELALTPWCAYYMWGAAAYFPCCPNNFGTDRLDDYFQNLKAGSVFAYCDHDDICPKLAVLKSEILKEKSSILVMCKRADHKWAIVGIELDDRSKHFIHFMLGSYLSKDEADKAFPIKKELNNFWSDGYANAYGL